MPQHQRDPSPHARIDNPHVPKVSIQEDLVALLALERRGTMVASRGVFSLEYPLMFGFSADLRELQGRRCLDIGSGYSSFAAEAAEHGVDVQAVDPLFPVPASPNASEAHSIQDHTRAISQLAQEELAEVSAKQGSSEYYVDSAWLVEEPLHTINTPGKLIRVRQEVLERFVADLTTSPERYVRSSLPELKGVRGMNDLILIGHILGAYSAQPWCDYAFHLSSILRAADLLSPSGEIRLYPAASGAHNRLGFPFDTPISAKSAQGATEEERFLRTRRCLADDLFASGLELELRPSGHRFVKGWTHTAVIRRTI